MPLDICSGCMALSMVSNLPVKLRFLSIFIFISGGLGMHSCGIGHQGTALKLVCEGRAFLDTRVIDIWLLELGRGK